MKRREFIALTGSAAAWPLASRAQPAMAVIGNLQSGREDDPEQRARFGALIAELGRRGWTQGRNLRIESRWGVNTPELRRAAAAELVALAPALIISQSSDASQALLRETRTIPIVFVGNSDPVSSGLVSSLARPGGNLTGFVNYEFPMGAKWLEMLKEAAPHMRRVLVIAQRDNLGSLGFLRAIEAAAPTLGIREVSSTGDSAAEIERAILAFAREPDGGLLDLPGAGLGDRDLIVGLASRLRLPAIYALRPFTESGGLMAYYTDIADLYRRAGNYVDRILHGEKPGELPVQLPTKFELVINLKTARALGLEMPVGLLVRADEVIE